MELTKKISLHPAFLSHPAASYALAPGL